MGNTILLKAQGLSKAFGNRKVIDGLSLNVEQGDIYGFLGQNGAGKTTTIRILTGLIFPDSGMVQIGGYNLRADFKKAISLVGAIVENPSFYTYLSGYDNLALMANLIPGIKKRKIDEVLEIVGLKDRAKDKVKAYSLGMRQRLGIANALLSDPKLVILDEPTNGLDPQGMKEIKELIIQLSSEKGISFFISSHLLHDVEQICNRVSIIKSGKLLAEGKVKDLLKSKQDIIEIITPETEKAIEILHPESYVKTIKKSQDGILVEVEKGYASKLNLLLVSHNIPVASFVQKANSLEKIFFEITEGGGTK